MPVNIYINAKQLFTYLRSFNILTYLDIINYKTAYSLSNYISGVNTNIFYKDTDIIASDVDWEQNVKNQEVELILVALNTLKSKIK